MLQDSFIEQNVQRKKPPMDGLIRGILITMTALTFFIFAMFVNLLFFIPFVMFAALTWWYNMNSDIEFDYTLTNRELEIAKIRGKNSIKPILTMDIGADLVVMAPSRTEPVQPWVGKKMKTLDCTSRTGKPYYCMIVKHEREEEQKILFEPSEELLEAMWRIQPRNVHKTA